MARLNPTALRSVQMDGSTLHIPAQASIADLVPREVSGITTVDPDTGATRLITRDQFRQVVPSDFMTHLTPIAKG